ncbi:MAG TPA: nucleoside monophosphate kinase [Candidatus Paceibacterota bacterium]
MKNFPFPIFKTKIDGDETTFKLEDPVERKKYFKHKAGRELQFLRDFLKYRTFMGFLLGKKNSGKGTYSKLFIEALGQNQVAHISVGDVVRNIHASLGKEEEKKQLLDFLNRRYRGFIGIDKILDVVEGRDTKTLLPTEVILALVEREIDALGRKAIFIDGFPRNLDQISYSLYFRALMGYREDPDFFVFIDVPETIIDARMRGRVICPTCHTPRHPKLLRTKSVGYDKDTEEFYLQCDNTVCPAIGSRMVPKEGDELGIEAIRERIEADDQIMKKLLNLEGVPKIMLRNALPVSRAKEFVDDY